jgi:hypothetical protein
MIALLMWLLPRHDTRERFFRACAAVLLIATSLASTAFLSASHNASSSLSVTSNLPLKFTVTQGGGATRSRAIVLKNNGKKEVNWTTSSTQGWLKFAPASGSLAAKGTASIEVIVDPEGFAPGIYKAAAQIGGLNDSPQSLDVTMNEESAFAGEQVMNAERTFPPDSGMVNVKTGFGAKGDGVSDDTEALQKAISSTVHHPKPGQGARIIYFPAGTYMVSHTLIEQDLTGRWNSLLTLQGENRATTTIKLTDNNPLYQNSNTPTDVVELASQNGSKVGGGNNAFDNNIFDLTIDVGRGNPGAVALNYMGNNYCALRNVALQASDPNHAGAVGLSMLRYAAGPCLMKNLVINGFDYGIKVANNEYSITFEDLDLINQRIYGIFNSRNVLSIRHLVSSNSVPVIFNQHEMGLITLVGAILQGGSSTAVAIQNQGTLYASDVSSSGYVSVLPDKSVRSPITEYVSGTAVTQFGSKTSSLHLPIEETPAFEDTDLQNWKSVAAYGADPRGVKDSADAIQSAIDSGATTVYFPTGVYVAAKPILVRGKVRMIEGFDSSINPMGELFSKDGSPAPLFKIQSGTSDVTINHMRIGAFFPDLPSSVIFVQQDSSRPLVLRDSIIGGPPTCVAYQNTSQGTGTLFVENMAAKPWQILFPQKVFARQFDVEGNETKVINKGGTLWILGLKTEGGGTNIETDQGGSTELLGGLIYPVRKVPTENISFILNESRGSFIYAVSNYKPPDRETTYKVQIEETRNGVKKSLMNDSLSSRGPQGKVMPLYSSGDDAKATSAPSKNK